jgi:branched-chain amino acid transport system substrate-binding protein
MKRMEKAAALGMALMLLATLNVFAGGGQQKETAGIKIGALFNQTGGQSSLDKPSYNGFLLAAEEINAAGGINGTPVVIVAYDGETDQTSCANNARRMIDVDKVIVVAGLSDSNYALAAGQICQAAKVPFVTSGATLPTLPDLVGDYAFLAPFGDDIQAYACADYFLKEKKYTKGYLLTDDSMEFTTTLAKFFKQRFEQGGGSLVLEDHYMNKDPDFSAQIDRFLARAQGAEFLFISGVPDDAGPIVKQFRDRGVTLPIISGDGFDTPLIAEIAGDQSYGVFVATHASLENPSAKVQGFVKNYTAKYGNPPENAFAALGYDTMYLLADALKRSSDPANPTALRDAIAATSGLSGVTGTVTYRNGSHVPNKSVTVNEIVDRKFVFRTEITP